MSAGASQTPLGKLTAFPRPPSWFQGGRFAAGGKWRGGERRSRGGEKGTEGKGGVEKGGERGKLGRNSALVVEGYLL